MSKIDKYNYCLDEGFTYNFRDKKHNFQNHVKYMLNRSLSMFKYHNLPETLPANELEMMLQTSGYAVVTDVNGNLYCFNGGLGGEPDVYGKPTEIVISNPALNFNKTLKLNEDCIMVKNDDCLIGLLPMYQRYCGLLTETDLTMNLAIINKRIQNYISANDDGTVESARRFLQKVEDGELGVIAENRLFDSLKVNNSTMNSGISMTELFEFMQYIKASLYNEIGLSANYNMKRERLTKSEVESNTGNLYPLVDNMLENRQKSVEKINEKYGTEITVEFNSSWDYRIFNGSSIHNTDEEIEGDIIENETETIETESKVYNMDEPDEPRENREDEREDKQEDNEKDEPDEPDEPDVKEDEN